MEQEHLFKARDKRKKGWFWMDNNYLNGYGKIFGAIGVAIYVSLCRHANNENQKCFPAQKTIAEELKITDRTVRKYLVLFQKYHIISISKERNIKTKKWINNVYTLLDKEEWLKPEEIVSDGKPEENNDNSQRKITTEARGTQRPINNTNINNTNNNNTNNNMQLQATAGKVINSLIGKFKLVNPSYEKLFTNTTQRSALERLVNKYGAEKIERLIETLPQTNQIKYFPVICTPLELENKLGALLARLSQEKNEQNKNKILKI